MKEAAGEANMTVVTIVLITAVVAVATPIITSMTANMGKKSCCQGAGGYWKNNQCYNVENNMTLDESFYWDASNKQCQ